MLAKPDFVPAGSRGLKESSVNIRVDEFFLAWVDGNAGALDMSRSDFVRLCIMTATPLLRTAPSLANRSPEDVAKCMEKVGNIFVLLEYV